jgi:hypothetical protein
LVEFFSGGTSLGTYGMSHRHARWEIQTASVSGFSEMGRASSEGEGEVSALDGGDTSGLEPGASEDEAPPFCATDEPLDEDDK